MLTFGQSYYKEQNRIYNPTTKRWEIQVLVPFTDEQFADLGAALELLLGEQFVSWAAIQYPHLTETKLEYNGLFDEDDLEIDRTEDISAAYQTWEQSY